GRCAVTLGSGQNTVTDCGMAERFEVFMQNKQPTSESSFGPMTQVLTVSMKNLNYHQDDEFFSSGDVGFTINNWNGTMHFSGGYQYPSWSASNSKGNAGGTYTPSSGGLYAPQKAGPKLDLLRNF